MSDSKWYKGWSWVWLGFGLVLAISGHPFTDSVICYLMAEVLNIRAELA